MREGDKAAEGIMQVHIRARLLPPESTPGKAPHLSLYCIRPIQTAPLLVDSAVGWLSAAISVYKAPIAAWTLPLVDPG